MFAICNLSIMPMRAEPSDKSEIVSQVLYGEHFEVLDTKKQWSKIKLHFDDYEGWVDSKQYKEISSDDFEKLSNLEPKYCYDLVEYLVSNKNDLLPITLGANLTSLDLENLNSQNLFFEGTTISELKPKNDILKTAFLYLNAPYLWGGKTPFGIDCSAFTQMVYKLNGYKLLRDASQQANQGEVLSFIEESEPGDLAFFDNEDGNIIHVGIILENYHIIHASGKVRIDRLDHLGIYNSETNKHTHKLRVIKKVI